MADSNFSYCHSATFSNDGTKVLFTDEWAVAARPSASSEIARGLARASR
ncbi:MAG: hypothetical protein ACOCVZ_10450 [Gemmatimonadota bacterium]